MKVDDFLRMGFASSVKVDKTFICEEKDKGAKLNRITIINIPTDSIALKLEHISMEGLTAKSIVKKLGYNQHCDYVIVTPDKCVFIEMKSNPNLATIAEEVKKKFQADLCLVNYSDDIFRTLLKKESFFNKRISHFVLLHGQIPFEKPGVTMRPENKTDNKNPDFFRPLSLQNDSIVDFSELI